MQCRISMRRTNRDPRLFAMRARWSENATVAIARLVCALFATTKLKPCGLTDAGYFSVTTC